MAYRRIHGVETRIARIFNTFGPRMRLNDGRAIPAFFTQALRGEPITVFGDGKQTRSFCFVDDLVDGLSRLLRSDYHEPVNLGNPEEWTVSRMAETIRDLADSNSPVEYRDLPLDDPKVRQPDITLARTELEWSPTTPILEGLARTLEDVRGRFPNAPQGNAS